MRQWFIRTQRMRRGGRGCELRCQGFKGTCHGPDQEKWLKIAIGCDHGHGDASATSLF